MCNHAYEELIPVFDDGGNIEAADGILTCSLIDDAALVLSGAATFGDLVVDEEGQHYELRYNNLHVYRDDNEAFDEEIPF